MEKFIVSIVENTIISSIIFLYLVHKAKIRSRVLYTDNILIIALATVLGNGLYAFFTMNSIIGIMLLNAFLFVLLMVFLTLIRFYRDPERRHNATDTDILSPADGFICYVRKIVADEVPFSVKGKSISKINELSKVDVIKTPCWLVGITMTLFDVHYIRSPISGRIVLNQYTTGKFLSLKKASSEVENERNTVVIENGQRQIGVIQIASKRVRGIRTFIEKGQITQMGQRIGMITFGSQADVIFPADATPAVKIGEWVYGGKTIIASFDI